jgi:Peptidase inhibitor family I36
MHSISIGRKAFLGALAALALLTGALLTSAHKASASLSQCGETAICVWENNNFTGNFSWWHSWEEGCHSHDNNPKIRSGEDRSTLNVRFGGQVTLEPLVPPFYTTFQLAAGANPITGQICWPV